MKRILLAFVAGAALACVTGPGRNPKCIYPGDTLTVAIEVDRDRRITSCSWVVADSLTCGLTEYWPRARQQCVVGDTVPR